VPSCAEGAIRIIQGKAQVIEDKYCDGLGACLGECPRGALTLVEREAADFDEEAVKELLNQKSKEEKKKDDCGCSGGGHHGHHGHHNQQAGHGHQGGGCPGSRMMSFENKKESGAGNIISAGDVEISIKSQLQQWPVQLMLVPPTAPYLKGADLLVTADCVAVAYPNYQLDLLKGRRVVMGCPKLDDAEHYIDKLSEMIRTNHFNSITVAYMEVPCCMGIVRAVDRAVSSAGVEVQVNKVKIGIQGDRK